MQMLIKFYYFCKKKFIKKMFIKKLLIKKPLRLLAIITPLLILCFFSCSKKNANDLSRYTFDGIIQGSYYHIVVYTNDTNNLKKGFDSIFSAIDKSVSLWDSNSTISKVNRNENCTLDKIFIDNFNASQNMSKLTDGCFDITVGKLVKEYGFTTQKRDKLSDKQIDSLLAFVGYNNIRIEGKKIIKKYPQTQIDFNAIAQGYTTDCISNYLINKGIKSFIVDVGGEVYSKGLKPNNEKWNVAIEKPSENATSEREYNCFIALKDKSIVTSGSYRKFYVENGVKYSHTIDPKTGRPVKHSLLSVSVIANTSTIADGLATSFMVMGLDKAKTFLSIHKEYDAYFIYCDKDGKMKTYCTKGFIPYIQK